MELVCTHHFAGVALRPINAVLKDSHTMWVLENLWKTAIHELFLVQKYLILNY